MPRHRADHDRGADRDGLTVDALGPPPFAAEHHRAVIVLTVDGLDDLGPLADLAVRADAEDRSIGVELSGEGTQGEEDHHRHAQEGRPLAADTHPDERQDGGSRGADGEGSKEERAGDTHLAHAEHDHGHEPDPPPAFGISHVHDHLLFTLCPGGHPTARRSTPRRWVGSGP